MEAFNGQGYIVSKHKKDLIITDESFQRFWKLPDDKILYSDTPKISIPNITTTINKDNFFGFNCTLPIESLDSIIIGVPFSKGSLIQSKVDDFPEYLREYSRNYPVYINLENFSASGLYDLSEQECLFKDLKFKDLGNLELIDAENINQLSSITQNLLKYTVKNEIKTVAIGGDHSITYSFVNSLGDEMDRPIILIIFDAHHDCRNNLYMTDKQVHHANFVRYLLEKDNLVKIIQIGVRGIRSFSQMLMNPKLTQISSRHVAWNEIQDEINQALEEFPNAIGYLSIDLDVISPNEFPDVDFPVPDGIPTEKIIHLIKALFKSNLKIYGIDIVEGLPNGERNNYSIPMQILSHCLNGINIQKQTIK